MKGTSYHPTFTSVINTYISKRTCIFSSYGWKYENTPLISVTVCESPAIQRDCFILVSTLHAVIGIPKIGIKHEIVSRILLPGKIRIREPTRREMIYENPREWERMYENLREYGKWKHEFSVVMVKVASVCLCSHQNMQSLKQDQLSLTFEKKFNP